MPLPFIALLPTTLAVGWYGSRMALYIRRIKGSQVDQWLMLALAWGPLAGWLLALLLPVPHGHA
jgi:hypothetical protein